jgi:DNA gyrase/topoisomerase IV subunit A
MKFQSTVVKRKGLPIVNLLKLDDGETIQTVINVENLTKSVSYSLPPCVVSSNGLTPIILVISELMA